LTAGEATRPVPRGAGMSCIVPPSAMVLFLGYLYWAERGQLTRTVTEPHFPLSFVGSE